MFSKATRRYFAAICDLRKSSVATITDNVGRVEATTELEYDSCTDKRKAVTLLQADTEWSQWSDSEIARHCQVSQSFVTGLRRRLSYLGELLPGAFDDLDHAGRGAGADR
jgi:hypothetical protein